MGDVMTTRRELIFAGVATTFVGGPRRSVKPALTDRTAHKPCATFDISIPVESLSPGKVLRNAFAGFTNPNAQVFKSSYWGASGKNYLSADDYKSFVGMTTTLARDAELTSWGANITMFLRVKNGKALYFTWNYERSGGELEIGIVTDLAEGGEYRQNGTYYGIWNARLSDLAPGYDPTHTNEDIFTFGANGFDIYLSYNNTELVRLKEYRHVVAGVVALQANLGYGFRDVGLNFIAAQNLFSIPESGLIDLRDFGLRDVATRGSIEAGSSNLIIERNDGFQIGDRIIVEVGSERGGGLRGSRGVGGTYPNLSYANIEAMSADTSQVNGTYGWLRDNGDVFTYWNGSWSRDGRYYLQKVVPKALVAEIKNISSDGRRLTLDINAKVAASNANVYLDNTSHFGLTGEVVSGPPAPKNIKISLPAGRFAISEPVSIKGKIGWQIIGQGKAETELFSPKGCRSGTIEVFESNLTVIRDLHLRGNAGNNGFGLDWSADAISTFPYGIHFDRSQNCLAENCRVTDAFMKSVGAAYARDCWARRVEVISTEAFQCYIQWLIQWSDSQLGGAEDCTIDSPYLTAGLEMFRSSGVIFRRISARNATFSSNSSGGNFLFEDCAIVIEPNSHLSNISFSTANPIINVNSNIRPPSPDMAVGGRIVRQAITVKGYINANNDNLIYCVINGDNPNITIEGTYPDADHPKGFFRGPDWRRGTNGFGGIFVRTSGANVTVRGMRFEGATDYDADAPWGHGPVHTEGGSCKVIKCVMDRPATGSFVTETGTQSNAEWDASH
jgi:hypothetical protein